MDAVKVVESEPESMPVYLTRGMIAYVSPEDHDRVSALKWQAHKGKRTWYARHVCRVPSTITDTTSSTSKFKSTYLHRFITGEEDPDVKIDHRDGNGLNNTRPNLRSSTGKENSRNTRKPTSGTTSQYKGVCWDEAQKRWRAQINVEGKKRCLGRYKDELPAALAYDRAALDAFGEFAQINFPDKSPDADIAPVSLTADPSIPF
jgi:hypothetical protein